MKFNKIEINNFRQYYGNVAIDLTTDAQKNIVVIGGKNGYGKTNLLLSIVWCLYGDKISQIDDHFKKAIQKEKNYSSFMQQSINWDAKKERIDTFSVTIRIDETELPELKILNSNAADSVIISREFNVTTMSESLHIIDPISNIDLFQEEEDDKINFINDYIIPIDAAKFVFFDAEKIAEIANLSIKEEGSFINDALGKILGLDTYETLIDDIESYINNLKKEGATKNLQEQIADKENAIKLSQISIEKLEEENGDSLKKIDELKKTIREFDNLISGHSKQGNSPFDREKILSEISELKNKETELTEKFNELSEVLSLTILAGKLEEVNEHIALQESNLVSEKVASENSDKIENFIELLFNKPPEPDSSTFSLKDKMFYYTKAQELGYNLFSEQTGQVKELDFEHDLSNYDKKMIRDSIDLVNTQSKDFFETTIEEFNVNKIKLSSLHNTLSKIDADLEDDIILEYHSKKEKADFQLSGANQNIGENKANIAKEEKNVVRLNQTYQSLLKKVEINKKNKAKIVKSNEYLDVLKSFVFEQKEQKKESLAENILEEMQKLMHKLNTNETQFVSDVKVTILAEGNGMKITLYNSDDEEIKKEVLSQGEKQLYISSLIKAILKESIQRLPIFIDTPLGRLDDEHIKNILLYYYPDLSEQVVILSTNNEITPKRFKDISESVSRSYLLTNDGINTKLKKGYFHSYED
jgi:DNA sulfur modification protein DndD